jgi:hypothetical protein
MRGTTILPRCTVVVGVCLCVITSLLAEHDIQDCRRIEMFLKQETPKGGSIVESRGPAGDVFSLTPAQAIARSIIDTPGRPRVFQLSESQETNLTEGIRRVSSHGYGKAGASVLDTIDNVDGGYEELLVHVYPEETHKHIAVELLWLEGLSALRRPLYEKVIGVEEATREKIKTSVEGYWRSGYSLHRGLFESGENQEIREGLRRLSQAADQTVLRLLDAGQIGRLELLLQTERVLKKTSR